MAELVLSDHPRAQRQIRTAKSWGGLLGFALGLILSLRANVPVSGALVRALTGGVICWAIAWGGAVSVWRQLAVAEIEARRRAINAQLRELAAEAEANPPTPNRVR
jgi:hypothetical protein